jgi:hypothetical protein
MYNAYPAAVNLSGASALDAKAGKVGSAAFWIGGAAGGFYMYQRTNGKLVRSAATGVVAGIASAIVGFFGGARFYQSRYDACEAAACAKQPDRCRTSIHKKGLYWYGHDSPCRI